MQKGKKSDYSVISVLTEPANLINHHNCCRTQIIIAKEHKARQQSEPNFGRSLQPLLALGMPPSCCSCCNSQYPAVYFWHFKAFSSLKHEFSYFHENFCCSKGETSLATKALEQKGAGGTGIPRRGSAGRSGSPLSSAPSEGRRACAHLFVSPAARVCREGRPTSGRACARCGAAGGSRKRRAHSSLRLRSARGLPAAERLDVGRVRRPWRWWGQEDGGRPRRGIVRRRRLLPGPEGRGETSGGARGRGARRRLDGERGRARGGAGRARGARFPPPFLGRGPGAGREAEREGTAGPGLVYLRGSGSPGDGQRSAPMCCVRLPGARLQRASGSDRNRAVPPWACGVPGGHRSEVGLCGAMRGSAGRHSHVQQAPTCPGRWVRWW